MCIQTKHKNLLQLLQIETALIVFMKPKQIADEFIHYLLIYTCLKKANKIQYYMAFYSNE